MGAQINPSREAYVASLLEEWAAGALQTAIAKREGLNRGTVREWFYAHPDFASRKAEREALFSPRHTFLNAPRTESEAWVILAPRLRELWLEGHSTAEIGRRLGVSKNAVVGKASRLDLPARPSPIRRAGGTVTHHRRVVPALPPLASTVAPIVALRSLPAPVPAPVIVPRPVTVAPLPPRSYGRVITCCWPIGNPGSKSFRFCDDNSAPGKSYCAAHCQIAFVKVRERREELAP